MSDPSHIDDVESLRVALGELLKEAESNDVDIEGGLTIRESGNQHTDWEVQIWQIE